MRLSEAIDFVRLHRPTWNPDAKGAGTAKINSEWCLKILGDIDLRELKSIHYSQLQMELKKLGKTPGTINRICSALSTIVNTLVMHEILEKPVRFNKLKEPRGRLVVYTDDQLEALLAACSKLENDGELLADIILFASKTGCRQGELLKLSWADVDLQNRELVFLDTKAGSDRVLPITEDLYSVLSNRYSDRIDEGLVFPIHKDTLLRRFRRAQKIAGISDKRLVFHTLRHYAATTLFARGAALTEVMSILGHSQITTTAIYSHSTKEGINRALNLL